MRFIGTSVFIVSANMAANISQVGNQYEERLRGLQVVPIYSHGRRMIRSDDAPNKAFFLSLFNHYPMAIEFLMDINGHHT